MASTAPFIAVGGNIATGKSGFVQELAKALGVGALPERWQENPWFGGTQDQAFASQLWFLLAAAADAARSEHTGGVQERCLHEHALVFGPELLHEADAQALRTVYAALDRVLRPLDLLVFLHATPQALAERVRERGRPQENELTLDRLARLDERYSAFFEAWTRCPKLAVDTERLDVRAPQQLDEAVGLVKEALS